MLPGRSAEIVRSGFPEAGPWAWAETGPVATGRLRSRKLRAQEAEAGIGMAGWRPGIRGQEWQGTRQLQRQGGRGRPTRQLCTGRIGEGRGRDEDRRTFKSIGPRVVRAVAWPAKGTGAQQAMYMLIASDWLSNQKCFEDQHPDSSACG